jgi:hypothetical protein
VELKEWGAFCARLAPHLEQLEAAGRRYRPLDSAYTPL